MLKQLFCVKKERLQPFVHLRDAISGKILEPFFSVLT